ncbi:hypothetical protein KZO25_13745 [Halomonas sp. ANAO-440]|uniref:hypothetical protein n=1 Tax=Halomonas sp. ANAO-440 TaxID=2861360 RepID=UPI001CAA692D|nr:hypothetical protein [Halomonas sp. ANAO-440]MBZ0331377.1 hypothetical protein [Halomonas sp. ANAO-440]
MADKPPVETEWDYLFGNDPVRHRPTEKEKLLIVSGSDFEGLMRASRLSIGLCLLHETIAIQKPLDDNHYFWLHHTDSILQLNMASDRIREYFVVAFFDETSDSYKHKGRKNGWYATPFIEARDRCQQEQVKKNIVSAVTPLPDMAEKIYSFRESRNGIVHDISTKLGKIHKELVESQQQAFDYKAMPDAGKDKPDYDLIRQKQNDVNRKHQEELSSSSQLIVDWYKALVKFSSHVFEVEHWLRSRNANA